MSELGRASRVRYDEAALSSADFVIVLGKTLNDLDDPLVIFSAHSQIRHFI